MKTECRAPAARAQMSLNDPASCRAPEARVGAIAPRELFRRWQHGRDQAAGDQLVERYMPLARKMARRYAGPNEPLEDLVQVASFGLLKALDRFDPERGIAFSSFAVPTILGELRRHFRNLGWAVHVPRGAQELALKVQQAEAELAPRAGHPPTVREVAQYLEVSVEDVLDGFEAAAAHHSVALDAPVGDEHGPTTLVDLIGEDDSGFALAEDHATITTAMRGLSPFERQVLHLRFFEDLTQSQIGKRMGVSQMQISRILRRTLDQLNALTGTGGSSEGQEVGSFSDSKDYPCTGEPPSHLRPVRRGPPDLLDESHR